MTGFTVVATVTLLLVSSPLLTISSPLLISAGLVLVAALAGFAGARATALTGLLALGWVFRSVNWAGMFRGIDDTGVMVKLIESGEKVNLFLNPRDDNNNNNNNNNKGVLTFSDYYDFGTP
ncbi:hypothetical protein RHGRI_009374 [Rhododendron griersonianum]|uniref:Oleosin n=1 Tax=Rhododendron griersonianum TaxID=479676 RepID=A0AAV6KF16_9ERIC|nr:hypothetical protein RHGRI_009374 [Rhododendron griersonianum]